MCRVVGKADSVLRRDGTEEVIDGMRVAAGNGELESPACGANRIIIGGCDRGKKSHHLAHGDHLALVQRI